MSLVFRSAGALGGLPRVMRIIIAFIFLLCRLVDIPDCFESGQPSRRAISNNARDDVIPRKQFVSDA
jgi:hypothetical protein